MNNLTVDSVSCVKWCEFWKKKNSICVFIGLVTEIVVYAVLEAWLTISKVAFVALTGIPFATVCELRLSRLKRKVSLMVLLRTCVDELYDHTSSFENYELQSLLITEFAGYKFGDMLSTESCISHLKELIDDFNAKSDCWKLGLKKCHNVILSSQLCILNTRKLLGDLE